MYMCVWFFFGVCTHAETIEIDKLIVNFLMQGKKIIVCTIRIQDFRFL